VEREGWDRESTGRERDGSKRALGEREREREREGGGEEGWMEGGERNFLFCFDVTMKE
jgi:hypothetical protein